MKLKKEPTKQEGHENALFLNCITIIFTARFVFIMYLFKNVISYVYQKVLEAAHLDTISLEFR